MMTTPATILIPDISGFTDFMNRTELDHAGHTGHRLPHNCVFMGLTMENTTIHSHFEKQKAVYVERVEIKQMNLDALDYYFLTPAGDGRTTLKFTIDWGDTPLTPEMKRGMLDGIMTNLELFKQFCEET